MFSMAISKSSFVGCDKIASPFLEFSVRVRLIGYVKAMHDVRYIRDTILFELIPSL